MLFPRKSGLSLVPRGSSGMSVAPESMREEEGATKKRKRARARVNQCKRQEGRQEQERGRGCEKEREGQREREREHPQPEPEPCSAVQVQPKVPGCPRLALWAGSGVTAGPQALP